MKLRFDRIPNASLQAVIMIFLAQLNIEQAMQRAKSALGTLSNFQYTLKAEPANRLPLPAGVKLKLKVG